MPDLDPGSLPFNGLAAGVNIRFEGGQVRNRWGFKKLKQLPQPWDCTNYTDWDQVVNRTPVNALAPHHMQHNVPVIWGASLTGGDATTTGSMSCWWFNPETNPVAGTGGSLIATDDQGALGVFAGSVYAVVGGHLYKLRTGTGLTTSTGMYPDLWEGGASVIGGGVDGICLQEHNGKLYIGSRAYYDGVSLVLTGETTWLGEMCQWRSTHLVGVEPGTSFYYMTDDVWSGASGLPSSYVNPYHNSMVEFRDAVWVASGREYIYRIVPEQAATAEYTSPGGDIYALTVLNDVLYFLRSVEDGGVWTTYLGMYEPDAASNNWKDNIKVINTDVYPYIGPGTALTVYRNKLVAGLGFYMHTHERPYDPTTKWYPIGSSMNNSWINGFRVGY